MERKTSILLVEDNNIAQKMAQMALQSLGCEVDVAVSGEDALTKFNSLKYDIIFMDLGLPDVDGLTVVTKIRKKEEKDSQHTIIIVLTANTDEDTKKKAIKIGVDDFIEKPLTMNLAQQLINKGLKK
jgi:two-component system, sensor histidine kinase and response regulator